jgi:hypothetical protein
VKLTRRYQVLPDYAECREPGAGCYFSVSGPDADRSAAAHVEKTGHSVRVETCATVTIGPAAGEVAR